MDNGEVYIHSRGRLQKALGPEHLHRELPVLAFTCDRGSINSSGIHFLQHSGFLIYVWWDFFHGMWNAIKNAATAAQHGAIWRSILEFLVCSNMNHGPFRSGQRFKSKQEWLQQYLSAHDHTSADFAAVVHDVAADFGMPSNTIEEQRLVFQQMAFMRYFNEKGPVLKLQRWLGGQEVWTWYEHELHGFKEVVRWANDSGRVAASADAIQEGTNTVGHSEIVVAMKRLSGTIALVPKYLSESNFVKMRIFSVATKVCWDTHSGRAIHIKHPEQGLEHNINLSAQGWQSELEDTIKHSLYTPSTLAYMRMDCNAKQDEVDLLVSFCFGLLTRRAESLVCLSDSYPDRSVLGLHRDAAVASEALQGMQSDWELILKSERVAQHHVGMSKVLASIFWIRHSLVRLVFAINELQGARLAQPCLDRLLRAMHCRLPDAKIVEDMHSHLRDETRTQRAAVASRSKRMFACVSSGVLERRGLKAIEVSKDEVATAPTSLLKKPLRQTWDCKPTNWPGDLTKILLPGRSWPSPVPQGYTHACSSWQWLKEAYWSEHVGLVPPDASWRSRLVPCPCLLRRAKDQKVRLVFLSADWGVLTWPLGYMQGDDAYLVSTTAGVARWWFVTSVADYEVIHFSGCVIEGVGVALRLLPGDPQQPGGCRPLAQEVVLNRGIRDSSRGDF